MSQNSILRLAVSSLVSAIALAGCGGSTENAGLPSGLPLAETVNGQAVPQVLLDILARERQLDLSVPEQRAAALNELTDYILLSQAALKAGYSKDPQFAGEVEINRLQGMANATMGKFQSDAQIDDSVLRVEYEQQIAKAGSLEYEFTQLLFDKEDDALAVAGEAVSKPFGEVYDNWKAKAKQASSFPRVRPAQLPEPVGNALAALKAGETSKVPVKSDFGWHVLHVTSVSPFTPPEFEQVKETIRQSLVKQWGDQRLAKLRSDAKISLETPLPAAAGDASQEPAPATKPAN